MGEVVIQMSGKETREIRIGNGHGLDDIHFTKYDVRTGGIEFVFGIDPRINFGNSWIGSPRSELKSVQWNNSELPFRDEELKVSES